MGCPGLCAGRGGGVVQRLFGGLFRAREEAALPEYMSTWQLS